MEAQAPPSWLPSLQRLTPPRYARPTHTGWHGQGRPRKPGAPLHLDKGAKLPAIPDLPESEVTGGIVPLHGAALPQDSGHTLTRGSRDEMTALHPDYETTLITWLAQQASSRTG